ncbi:MAG: DUF1178 family protein [Burkholderiaceae bacterium]|jgi:hypothetical protein
MKVFNLRCSANHQFEGWFPSAEESERQLANKLTRCPVCDSTEVTRSPSAPRLKRTASASTEVVSTLAHTAWIKALRELIQKTEDVGERFAEEARRIHYNEVPERAIRGVATEHERQELQEEGIEVVALPLPAIVKEPLQ